MDLDSMKYAELRSLAKELGLKGKLKADKLLKAIKQYYQKQEQQQEEDGQGPEKDATDPQGNVQEAKVAPPDEPVSSTFVTNRRGKGASAKRKVSDVAQAPECDPQPPRSAAEKDEGAEPGAAAGTRGSKRRRLSREFGTAEPPEEILVTSSGLQPGVKDDTPAPCNEGQQHVGNERKGAKAGRIPRHEGLLKKSKPSLKPNTPNFKKLHEAQFNKMESIDSYVQRKNKHVDSYRNSVKEQKMIPEKTILKQTDGKIQTVNPRGSFMFSPVVVKRRPAEDSRSLSVLSDSKPRPTKPALKENAPFRPSVLSARRINVRFSQATQDNENKRSLVKTPTRLSHHVSSSTPNRQTSTPSGRKTLGAFVFTADTSVVDTSGVQKPTFDLKASLSRPLNYKPHKGKLKPFGETKENVEGNKSLVVNSSHKKNYKQHQVQTRADRRVKCVEDRKQKKESLLGARRGLVMA